MTREGFPKILHPNLCIPATNCARWGNAVFPVFKPNALFLLDIELISTGPKTFIQRYYK